jgi:hypothetical protein
LTEDLNRRWYEANTGQVVTDIQRQIRHPVLRWMAATLDGRVAGTEAVFEAKFMLPWYFSEEAAVQKYMPQLQHNMWVVAARSAVLSVITGGGKWVEITTHADPLYQDLRLLSLLRLPPAQTYPRTPAVFVDELNAGPLQYDRDSGERLLIPCIPAGLDIGDRVAMKLSGFCEVADGPI